MPDSYIRKIPLPYKAMKTPSFPTAFFDVAIGNVPLVILSCLTRNTTSIIFLSTITFLRKTLDKVRPGGVIAFITSSGTMDKRNSKVRKYIAQRADLIGAVRLPNNTFKKNAGTEVTADILFCKSESV